MTDAPARIEIVRRIEWQDTDAAGVYHWSTVFRLVEAAEAALHDRLGIRDYTFGRTPRVHVSCDFRRELAFWDAVRTELEVAEVGESSVRYAFALYREDEDTGEGDDAPAAVDEDASAAEGEMVGVHVSAQPGGSSEPWPAEIRDRLAAGGDQGRVEGA